MKACLMSIGVVIKMTLLLLVLVTTVQGASFNALMKKGNKYLSKTPANCGPTMRG